MIIYSIIIFLSIKSKRIMFFRCPIINYLIANLYTPKRVASLINKKNETVFFLSMHLYIPIEIFPGENYNRISLYRYMQLFAKYTMLSYTLTIRVEYSSSKYMCGIYIDKSFSRRVYVKKV